MSTSQIRPLAHPATPAGNRLRCMTEAAQRFLRSFRALPAADQRDVLVSLLRLPIEAEYQAPSDDDLVTAAEQVFLALDEAEKRS
jgi:hypothetical protein